MNSKKGRLRVLAVDDELLILQMVAKLLNDHGYQVDAARSVPEALRFMAANKYDALITDIQMPGESGNVLLRHVMATLPTLPVVVITADPSKIEAPALSAPFVSVVTKPFKLSDLVGALRAFRA